MTLLEEEFARVGRQHVEITAHAAAEDSYRKTVNTEKSRNGRR